MKVTRSLLHVVLTLCGVLILFTPSQAQLPELKLYILTPQGGQIGKSVDVKIVSGDSMEELNALQFNHPGIKAVPKKDEKGNEVANTFTVTIDGSVPAGFYEVRAKGYFGLSNPRTFHVDKLESVDEKENNNTFETAQEITLNTILQGKSDKSGDVDYYKYQGKKGQRVIATCLAEHIDSQMTPAMEFYTATGKRIDRGTQLLRNDELLDLTIPEDGTYFLKIYDFAFVGADSRYYRLKFHSGPHIDFVMPPTGVPGTTSEFTLYGRNLPGGKPSKVKLQGDVLDELKVNIPLPKESDKLATMIPLTPSAGDRDGFNYVLKSPQGDSNPIPIYFSSGKVIAEAEPNNEAKQAQKVTLPVEIAGQFQSRKDVDRVSFEAKKGEVYYIEVTSQRMGSPADPYMVVEQLLPPKDGQEQLKRITAQDDNPANLAANVFDTISDDPIYKFTVPADGTYIVTVRDRYFQSRGNPTLIYQLCIRKPNPDFRLVVLPFSNINNQGTSPGALTLRRGGNISARVIAFRRDGFDAPIEIIPDNLPAGITCNGATVGTGESTCDLVISADENATVWSGQIQIKGQSKWKDPAGKDHSLTRIARTGTVVWKASQNTPPTSRMSQSLGLSIVEETIPFQVVSSTSKFEVNQGRQILIPIKLLRRNGWDDNVNMSLQGLPKNSNIQGPSKATFAKGKETEQILRLFVNNNAKLGSYSLYFKADSQFNYVRYPQQLEKAKASQKQIDADLKKVEADRKTLEQAVQKVTQMATAAANELKQAQQQKVQADNALKAAKEEEAKKKATAQQQEAAKKLKAAEEKNKAAQTAKQKADADLKAKSDELKAVQNRKKSVDTLVKNATNATKPKNTKLSLPTIPVILKVKKAPASISASVPNGGKVKKGQKLEIKVSVKRDKEFKGPLTLSLPLPPNVKGLSAAPVTIPPDKNDGQFVIQTAADATEGQLANLVVRAKMSHNGNAEVDAPITVSVTK